MGKPNHGEGGRILKKWRMGKRRKALDVSVDAGSGLRSLEY